MQIADSTTTAAPSTTSTAILQAIGVGKSFRMGDSQIDVLKNCSLKVQSGEFIAIEGRSGSGKSTLLHLLGALDSPGTGSIYYKGDDLTHLGGDARSRLRNKDFGFVFQFYHLLPELNVLENTLLASVIEFSPLAYFRQKKQLKERGRAILSELGLEHRLKHRPAHLSGGERQRVAIARALMNNPKVLFADEPTGNLDFETGQQIMAVLERLHRDQKQTIIMVTHDRTLARQADRVLVLKEGKLDRAE